MLDTSVLTEGQSKALSLVQQGRNVFVTGPGGTGKSFLFDYIMDWAEEEGKRVIACAPTGIAALKIGGCTLHKALCIKPSDTLEVYGGSALDKPSLFYKSPLWNCDLLVLDEVSMCRIDLFDYLTDCVEGLNEKRAKRGEKPLQLVLMGDFYQLPPVLTPQDVPVMTAIYGDSLNGGYCLNSDSWFKWRLETVELTEVMRQSDAEFVEALNKCRCGDVDGLHWIVGHSAPSPVEGAVRLYGRNAEVDAENSLCLNMIDLEPRTYYAKTEGQFSASSRLAPDELVLKVGARVMLVCNLDDGKHANGSLGYVMSLGEFSVEVMFDDGKSVIVTPHQWEIKAPRLSGNGIVIDTVGTYTQVPLKLAWAITIHKSQGQTFDAVTLNPSCWESGQLYTALSRVADVNGLHFLAPCQDSYLIAPSFPTKPLADEVRFWHSVGTLAVRAHELAQSGEKAEEGDCFNALKELVMLRKDGDLSFDDLLGGWDD